MVDRVNASLLGPETYNFQHDLECMPVGHIVNYVLACDAPKQTALSHVAQLLKLVCIRTVILFEQLMNAFRFFHICEQNVKLN